MRGLAPSRKMRRTTRSISASRQALVRRAGLRERKVPPKDPAQISVEKATLLRKKKRSRIETDDIAGRNISSEQSTSNRGRDDKTALMSDESTLRVLVLGAGIAGLACARELQQRGFDVLVLEGRTRPGGRLKTIPLRLFQPYQPSIKSRKKSSKKSHPLSQHCTIANIISSLHKDHDSSLPPFCPIDVGGAFIHGIDENPIYEMCRKVGISASRPMKGEDCLLVPHNSAWPVKAEIDFKVQKRFNYVLDQAFKLCSQIMRGDSNHPNGIKHEIEVDHFIDSAKNDGYSFKDTKNEQGDGTNQISTEVEIADLPIPPGANSQTSFGFIFNYVAADGKVEVTTTDTSDSDDPFKYLRNGGYPQNSIEASLFGWHVMNLEMSCGTTFDNLGLTWNDDEAYGYGGDHVLLREGFGALIECLKEGLNIKYGTEVTGISIVGDVGIDCSDWNEYEAEENRKILSDNQPINGGRPNTFSIRRSCRKNKGKIGMMNIGHQSRNQIELGSYDVNEKLRSTHMYLKNKKTTTPKVTEKKYPVQVRTKCNLVLEADAIVCTLPLGVLSIPEGESGHITFSPPLPERKKIAIERLGFGNYNKCVLSFPKVFWSSAADFVGVIGSPIAGTNVLFCNVSVVHDGLPVIAVIYGGKDAEEVEKFTDAQVVNECMAVLERVCGNSKIPLPTDYCVTRWRLDKFARGSFSYCPVGINGEQEHRILSKPLCVRSPSNKCGDAPKNPLVLFAGEATTPYHPSTVHGAYLSGIREAYRMDFSYFPKENNYLKFQESYLYKRTFTLRRRFAKKKKSHRTHVMKQKKKNSSDINASSTKSERLRYGRRAKLQVPPKQKNEQVDFEFVRRSRRNKDIVLSEKERIAKDKTNSNAASNRVDFGCGHSEETSVSEDIALLRGVDTFGQDEDAIKLMNQFMFPVPVTNKDWIGGRQNSTINLQRYKELVIEGADTDFKASRPDTKWLIRNKLSNGEKNT